MDKTEKEKYSELVASKLPLFRGDQGEWGGNLARGFAVQFYLLSGSKRLLELQNEYNADAYATERNGDPIGMLVPKGTPKEKLPVTAMDYFSFGWWNAKDYDAMPDVS